MRISSRGILLCWLAQLERLTAHVVSPIKDVLTCEVLAWTPSTRGAVRAKAYQMILPERPSQEQLTAFFEREGEGARPDRDGNKKTGVSAVAY